MFPKSDNLLFPLKVGLVFLSINFLFFLKLLKFYKWTCRLVLICNFEMFQLISSTLSIQIPLFQNFSN